MGQPDAKRRRALEDDDDSEARQGGGAHKKSLDFTSVCAINEHDGAVANADEGTATEEDAQDLVDDAFAAFVSTHQA